MAIKNINEYNRTEVRVLLNNSRNGISSDRVETEDEDDESDERSKV